MQILETIELNKSTACRPPCSGLICHTFRKALSGGRYVTAAPGCTALQILGARRNFPVGTTTPWSVLHSSATTTNFRPKKTNAFGSLIQNQ